MLERHLIVLNSVPFVAAMGEYLPKRSKISMQRPSDKSETPVASPNLGAEHHALTEIKANIAAPEDFVENLKTKSLAAEARCSE
jgi:hypothetical protein